jgi:hypothetical protein
MARHVPAFCAIKRDAGFLPQIGAHPPWLFNHHAARVQKMKSDDRRCPTSQAAFNRSLIMATVTA